MKVKTLVLNLLKALERGGSLEDKAEAAALRRRVVCVDFAKPISPAKKGGKR